MFVGISGSGKTSLVQSLSRTKLSYDKTQAIEFYQNVIDTPGEYLENRRLYSALINTASESDIVAFILDASCNQHHFAPNFASAFNKKVIGIVTKTDLVNDNDLNRHRDYLIAAGAKSIFITSSKQNKGIDELRSYLKWN
ncbi:EutP/PduV family microcompartment system protein [Vibrio sp. 10N.222.51.C12]|uniref:EutP/PduV family microcompartment system protein n=1 Tax=unclassified Vibrio TaxID=2614977 RepID=UPI000C823C6B